MARGPAEGGRPAPGQRRVLAAEFAVIDAAAQHARHEAEVGGYVAAAAAAPALDAGRSAIAALTGMTASDVVYTTGSNNSLDLLLSSWTAPRTVACLPGEYGPNLAVMAANDFDVRGPAGRRGRPPGRRRGRHGPGRQSAGLVHLTPLASHRGIVQPARELAEVCRGLGVPLVIDAAQALGHIDCAVGADADLLVVAQMDRGATRCWRARDPTRTGRAATAAVATAGVGPAVHGDGKAGARRGQSRCARRAFGRARENLAAGPENIRAGLAELGRLTRTTLAISTAGGSSSPSTSQPRSRPCADQRRGPAAGAGVAHRRARHRHHLRRGAARAVRDGRAGAAGVPARRHHGRRPGHVRRSTGRRDRRGVTAARGQRPPFCTDIVALYSSRAIDSSGVRG